MIRAKIVRISMSAPDLPFDKSSLKPAQYVPLTKFKTSKGIGIGSTLAAARRAYPHAHFATSVTGSGDHETSFTLGKGPKAIEFGSDAGIIDGFGMGQ